MASGSQIGRLYDLFDTDPGPVVGFLQWLADVRGLPADLHVLDVGAGTGRLIRPLAELGWRVTAAEPDPGYREHAEAVAAAVGGAVVTAEAFGDLAYTASFDLAIAVNSAFAHLVTPRQREDVLTRLHRALRPGGVLFLDLPNFLWILRHYRPPEEQVREVDGRVVRLLRRHEIDVGLATFTTVEEYTVVEPDGQEAKQQKRHVYAMTAPPDVIRSMEEAGFEGVETHTGYDARGPERLDGPRMLLTTRRGRS